MSNAPKMTRPQSLYLASIRRLGGVVLTQTVVADGRLSVLYMLHGRRTRAIVFPDGRVQ